MSRSGLSLILDGYQYLAIPHILAPKNVTQSLSSLPSALLGVVPPQPLRAEAGRLSAVGRAGQCEGPWELQKM